jgi:tetratricopeptide (TPR) repeat protein
MAYLLLGKMEYQNGDYQASLDAMNQVINLDRNQRESYLFRFLSNIELGNGDQADDDIDRVLLFYGNSFDARLAIIKLHLLQKRNGSALLELDKAEALAETDEQKAQVYYWGAIVYERRNDPEKAAEYWKKLVDLPEESMTPEMRAEAEKYLATVAPPKAATRTSTPARTPTRTPTPSGTPTRTPTS